MKIDQTLEVLAAVELLAVAGKKVAKDGLSLADLPEALELLKHLDVLVAAVKGADEVVAEIKDLDQGELIVLGTKVVEIVKAIKSA